MQDKIREILISRFPDVIEIEVNKVNELTATVKQENLIEVCNFLKTDPDCLFEQLIDLCGVDYLAYGLSEWDTESATSIGFSRGVKNDLSTLKPKNSKRFAVVYHLLSVTHNHRIRLKVFPNADFPVVPSVIDIWKSANWYEREAFDLFGILFSGHPDLRRILTDYGFIGHPFRKDFPLIGKVEVKYDEAQKRVIYQPVTIENRVSTPKIIRNDQRYAESEQSD